VPQRVVVEAGVAADPDVDHAFKNAQCLNVYLTNVVKHFKWTARGKRRLHEKPDAREIAACRPWLEAELERERRAGQATSYMHPHKRVRTCVEYWM